MKTKTITIGIAAYNSQDNIARLLKSLLKQESAGIKVNKIYVYCDRCTDNTARNARSVASPKISVIDGKVRGGFAGAVKTLIPKMTSDIGLLLNDDIVIEDDKLLEKLVRPFGEDNRVGLVCGNPRPLIARTFIEKSINSGVAVFEKTLFSINNIHNKFFCDGKILALHRRLLDSLRFPADNSQMGNVDSYLYFYGVTHNFKFRFVPEARVLFRQPTTLKDFVKLTIRNYEDYFIHRRTFGDIVSASYEKPDGWIFYKNAAAEFLKHPLSCLVSFGVSLYARYKARDIFLQFNPAWDVSVSTKDLN